MRKTRSTLFRVARLEIAMALSLGVAFYCGNRSAFAQEDIQARGALFRTQVATDGDHLLVPVTIQGRSYPFVVDTGSTRTVYDIALRELLGPTIGQLSINGGEQELDVVHPPRVAIGSIPVDTEGLVMDCTPMRSVNGNTFFGVLGMDVLAKHVVDIDSDRGTFSIVQSLPADTGERCDIEFFDGLPFVAALLPGIGRELFLIDTGANGRGSGGLRDDLVAPLIAKGLAMPLRDKTKSMTATGIGISGGGVVVKKVSLAGIDHRSLIFHPSGVNRLGMRLLIRHRVILDFPNKAAYLKPSRFFNMADVLDVSGMHLLLVDGLIRVDSIDASSPAAKAGIKAGDVVVSVGPHLAGKSRLHQMREMLCQEGKVVPIMLQRADDRRSLSLKLERDQSN